MSGLKKAEAFEGLPYTSNAGVYARRPLAGEEMTTKNLTVWLHPRVRGWRRTPDRNARNFFEFPEPKNEFEIAGPGAVFMLTSRTGRRKFFLTRLHNYSSFSWTWILPFSDRNSVARPPVKGHLPVTRKTTH